MRWRIALLAVLCLTRLSSGWTAPPSSPVGVEARIETLEAQNRELQQTLDNLLRRLGTSPEGTIREAPLRPSPEQLGRPITLTRDVVQTDGEPLSRARVDLEQGIRLLSPDGRFRIELHNLTQAEGRFFSPTGDPLSNNFNIPRQRLFFSGIVDEDFEFYSSFQRGYGAFDLFDAFVNLHFSQELNFRCGRMKTPYTYEYYKTAEGDLMAPERSLFVGNLSPNRQIGLMVLGRLFADRLEYAVGLFNGPQRSFQDFNNYKNPFLYFNARPFLHGSSDLIRYLNFGLSANYGRQDDLLEPNALRTSNDETINPAVALVSPAFLQYNEAATIFGEKAFWAADLNWFYRGLTLQLQYNGGFITYRLPQDRSPANSAGSGLLQRVPYTGGSAAVSFFVTGEDRVTRKEVIPLRPFKVGHPVQNPGAIELFSRVAYLEAGPEVFANGLADPRKWSRNSLTLDNGVHWYPNRYVKITFAWQHSEFGSPVRISPTRRTDSIDLFWLRTQLYY